MRKYEQHTQTRIASIMAMSATMTFSEIAAAFGMTRGQVAGIVYRHRARKKTVLS